MPDINPDNDDTFYDLVLVGRGYSASTYLFTADLSWCKKILIIAGPDAWDTVVRGDGAVNHPEYIFARDKTSNVNQSEPSSADTLKDQNKDILDRSIAWLKGQEITIADNPTPGVVTAITRKTYLLSAGLERGPNITVNGKQKPAFAKQTGDAVEIYEIAYNQWDQMPTGDNWDAITVTPKNIKAMKVVYCGGAGPHAERYSHAVSRGSSNASGANYMDMDTFMRRTGAGGDLSADQQDPVKKVALIGGNAGIDAAIRALEKKFDLSWLISGPQNSDPAWLSTKHYTVGDLDGLQTIAAANQKILNYPKDNRFTLVGDGTGGEPYKFTFPKGYTPRGGVKQPDNSILVVDYVAYAIGQDPANEEKSGGNDVVSRIGPFKVLRPILQNTDKSVKEQLTPIYDINQRYGSYFETALALQDKARSKYTGLEVFGAAALALSSYGRGAYVKQAFFEDFASNTRSLDISLQENPGMEDFLKAIQNTTWNDSAQGARIYDYLNNRGSLPSVNDSMVSITKKLYLQTVLAADQLGSVKSQIEAANGFDIIASATDRPETLKNAETLLNTTQDLQKALQVLKADKTEANLQSAKEKRTAFTQAYVKLGSLDVSTNTKANEYFALLSAKEQKALKQEGVDPNSFAATINQKKLHLHTESINVVLFFSLADVTDPKIDEVLDTIPAVQVWLTNLMAIYQIPDAGAIDTVVNFNSMDRSQLAVLLAVQYPAIIPTDWPEITTLILEGRKVSPWGYKTAQVTAIETWLKGVNDGTKAVGEFPELSTA